MAIHSQHVNVSGVLPKQDGKSAAFSKIKPAFSTGASGKTQTRDRSGGVKKARIHPNSEGI